MGIFSSKPQQNEEKTKEIIEIPRTTKIIETEKAPIVLLFRYIGTQYHGLQLNLEVHTVEKELFGAIIAAGLLEEKAYLNLTKIKWKEASRTDAGVHACAAVVSFLASNTEDLCVGDIPEMINSKLPKTSTINVLAAISITKPFDAQRYADSRNYHYLLPVEVFSSTSQSHLDYLRNEIMPCFIGTLNYHNFTTNMPATSASAMRTIDIFTFSDPFDVDGVKCVLFTIHGVAFMLNQIRKMTGLVIAASHGQVGPEEVKRCLSTEDWRIKMLVGDGLMLDKVEYKNFNKGTRKHPFSIETDVEFGEFRPEIERWKREVLLPHIIKIHKEQNVFNIWVQEKLSKYRVITKQEAKEEYERTHPKE